MTRVALVDEFFIYLRVGFSHIADIASYDHILFIAALAIPYAPRDWRRVALLATAFTVGHSLTLALATLQFVSVPSAVVETLIPCTIVMTAALALFEQRRADMHQPTTSPTTRYALAVGFGFIHGLGFSTYLRALLGTEESLVLPLFAFNIGLEIGQLLILSIVLAIGAVIVQLGLSRRRWMLLLATTIATMALMLLVQRLQNAA